MIIGIAGFGGSGKTLLAVGITRYLQTNGYKVITNILSYKYRDYDLITELPEIMTSIRKNPAIPIIIFYSLPNPNHLFFFSSFKSPPITLKNCFLPSPFNDILKVK